MKRLFIVISAVVLVYSSFSAASAAAQDAPVMTDAHVQRIQANCPTALASLQRVHISDGLLRVNRGQIYDSLSTKLMTRLNSRLALNKLDASALVKITAAYDKALSAFRVDYKRYDDQMSAALAIDCRKQPVAFYDAVTQARQLRATVHTEVTDMRHLVVEYQKAFDAFHQQFGSSRPAGEDKT